MSWARPTYVIVIASLLVVSPIAVITPVTTTTTDVVQKTQIAEPTTHGYTVSGKVGTPWLASARITTSDNPPPADSPGSYEVSLTDGSNSANATWRLSQINNTHQWLNVSWAGDKSDSNLTIRTNNTAQALQAAIDNSTETNDTIIVGSGIYNGSISISRDGLILRTNGSVELTGNNSVSNGVVLDANNATVEGFRITNYTGPGILVGNNVLASGNIIDGNVLVNNNLELFDTKNITVQSNTIYAGGSNEGIDTWSFGEGESQFINNTITDTAFVGLDLSSGSNLAVNNNVSFNDDIGILVQRDDNIVRNNTVNNNGGEGLTVSWSNNIIAGNTVKNNGEGIAVSGTQNTIRANRISSNGDNGVTVGASSSGTANRVVNNTIRANGRSGILIGSDRLGNSGHGTVVVNNSITGNTDDGITVEISNNVTLRQNIVENNQFGITTFGDIYNLSIIANEVHNGNIWSGIELGSFGHVSNSTVANNKIWGNSPDLTWSGGSNNRVSNNTVSPGSENGMTLSITASSILNNTATSAAVGVKVSGRNNSIKNNTLKNNDKGLEISATNSSVRANKLHSNSVGIDILSTPTSVRNNRFSSNSVGLRIDGQTDAGLISVHKNKFQNNGNYGLENGNSSTLNATFNWWGATDGPGGDFVGSGDAVIGNVTVSPYYTDANLTTISITHSGKELIVNKSDPSTYNSIQGAVNAATSGASILVHTGVYNETVQVDKTVTIVSRAAMESSDFRTPGSPDKAAVLDSHNRRSIAFNVQENVSGLHIEGFTIRNYTWGVQAWNAFTANVTVRNTTIRDVHEGFLVGSKDSRHVDWTVVDNQVINASFDGIDFFRMRLTNTTIRRNSIQRSANLSDERFSVGLSIVGTAENVMIHRNSITGTYDNDVSSAISIRAGDPLSGTPGVISNLTIAANYIAGHISGDGIFLGTANRSHVSDVDITNNLVRNATTALPAIDIVSQNQGHISSVSIRDNYLTRNRHGIGLGLGFGIGTRNGTYENITILDNDITGNQQHGIFGGENASGDALQIHTNRVEGNGKTGLRHKGSGTVNATHNWWGASDGPSGDFSGSGDAVIGNVTVHPYYRNANLTTLQSGSVRVFGQLSEADGTPAADDSLAFFGEGPLGGSDHFTKTNASGHFAVEVGAFTTHDLQYYQANFTGPAELAPGSWPRDGSPDMVAVHRINTSAVSDELDLGTTSFPDAHVINVTAVDQTGRPVPNATFWVTHHSGEDPADAGLVDIGANEAGMLTLANTSHGRPGIELFGNVTVRAHPPKADPAFQQKWQERELTVTSRRNVTIYLRERPQVSLQPMEATLGVNRSSTLRLTLSTAPEGLAGYWINVTVANGSVASITNATTPAEFTLNNSEITAGNTTATVAATDLSDQVGPTARNITLGTVTVTSARAGQTQLRIDVIKIDNDNGSALTAGVMNGSVTVQPLPVVCSGCGVPTDPDDDGRFEDINGNGAFDFDDIVVLFEHLIDPVVSDHTSAYDFNANERIDFDDIITLFEEI